jgi:CheY-like chemotaxis protein
MISTTRFIVLVVGDDPEMLELTRVLLRDMEVFGLRVHVETARSRREAIEVLRRYDPMAPARQLIAVAFVDIALETSHAGLELCDFIRNELNNQQIQLYLCTAHPGPSQARDIIDRYDLNGYYLKSELDENRVYCLVKAGIRQVATVSHALAGMSALETIVVHSITRRSLEWIITVLVDSINASGMEPAAGGERPGRVELAFLMDGQMISSMPGKETTQLLDDLNRLEHHPLGTGGDYYTLDGRSYLIWVAPSPTTAGVYALGRGPMLPSRDMLVQQYLNSRTVAALWKQGGSSFPPA